MKKFINREKGYAFKFLFLFGLFTVFKEPVDDVLSNILIKPIWSLVGYGERQDIGFLIIGILFIYRFWFKEGNSSIKSFEVWASIFILAIYLSFYRFSGEWVFFRFFDLDQIYYADLILILPPSSLLLRKVLLELEELLQEKKQTSVSKGFIEDNPINDRDSDLMGLGPYANRLATIVYSTYPKGAFAIGLNGLWGSGKTSFVHLFLESVDTSEFLIFKFNPWNSSTPQGIINDFFNGFRRVVENENPRLARDIYEYGNKLLQLNKIPELSVFPNLAIKFFKDPSVDSLQDELEKELSDFSKRVIVIIDDLDRLDEDELFETLRLIRNTANFSNLIYIACYDREYVSNAIGKKNEHSKIRYLDKIFPVEISLPRIERDVYQLKFQELLDIHLPESAKEETRALFEERGFGLGFNISSELDSLRTVHRLVNAIKLNYHELIGEVDLSDFIKIELFRIKYARAYQLLRDDHDRYLNISESKKSEGGPLYFLAAKKDETPMGFQNNAASDIKTTELYKSFERSLGGVPLWLEEAITFLNFLFGASQGFNLGNSVSPFSIRRPEFIGNYFSYKLLPTQISQTQFDQARFEGLDSLLNLIDQTVKDGLEFQISNKLRSVVDFESKEDYETIIRSIFYLARKDSKKSNHTFSKKVLFPKEDLYSRLTNIDGKKSEKLYNGDEEELKSFVKELFEEGTAPFEFEFEFIRYVNRNGGDHFILRPESLQSLGIEMLSKTIDFYNEWNTDVLQGFYALKRSEKAGSAPTVAKSMIQEYLHQKGINGYLLLTIDVEVFDKKTFSISKGFLEIFDNLENLKTFLSSMPENPSVKEYLTFLSKLERNGMAYINFSFKHIPIQEKIDLLKKQERTS